MTDLTNRRALVTGSTRGIGAKVADALAAAGADVVLSARSAEDLTRQAAEIADKYGVHAASVPADLADADEVLRLASESLAAFDGLDILVNNAGVSFPEPVTTVSVGNWNATMDVNLRAACLLASRVGSAMADAGSGSIVNISSAAGIRALRDHYAYSISKAGLVMATQVLALELGSQGVRANIICPTVVMTEMGQRVWGDEAKAAPMLARIPAGHFAAPSDVAEAVLFLVSPVANMINGVTLPIDGGYTVT